MLHQLWFSSWSLPNCCGNLGSCSLLSLLPFPYTEAKFRGEVACNSQQPLGFLTNSDRSREGAGDFVFNCGKIYITYYQSFNLL